MAMSDRYHMFTWLGSILIVVGILFVLIPYLMRYVPAIEKLPPILVYIYRRDSFFIATSPILIIISVIAVIAYLLSRYVSK
jgi:flagellar biogenesis protein FliO